MKDDSPIIYTYTSGSGIRILCSKNGTWRSIYSPEDEFDAINVKRKEEGKKPYVWGNYWDSWKAGEAIGVQIILLSERCKKENPELPDND